MMIPDSSFLLRRELDTKNKHGELAEAKVICGFYTSERDVQDAVCRHIPIQLYVCAWTRALVWNTVCLGALSNSRTVVLHSSGVNTWRDQLRPTQLLQNVARFKGFPPPVLSEDGSRIRYGGRDYHLDEFGEHEAVGCKHGVITHFCCCNWRRDMDDSL